MAEQPPADQPQQGSAYPPNAAVPPPGPRPPEREGLSTGCWAGVVILAVLLLLFGVCLVSLAGLSYE